MASVDSHCTHYVRVILSETWCRRVIVDLCSTRSPIFEVEVRGLLLDGPTIDYLVIHLFYILAAQVT